MGRVSQGPLLGVLKRVGHQALLLRLLRQHGWNATAYQIVNPGFELWFTPECDAVIAYVTKGRYRVVAGAPVCSLDALPSVVDLWESECGAAGVCACYFGAAGRLARLFDSSPRWSRAVLGGQPVWQPAHWAAHFDSHPSLRAQLNRAQNKGVQVQEWPVEQCHRHPELQKVLDEWLATRGLPPLHFLVEPDTLGTLTDKRVFVASRGGEPVGFVTLAPVPARKGWLTEQFVRGAGAPNGTVESIVDLAVRTVAAEGSEYVTMGLVPLSEADPDWSAANPAWLRLLATWARAHGKRFYNFGGLERFKTKFHPDFWEPIYAYSNEARFSFGALHAIAGAFTGGPPSHALAVGLAKAVRTEVRRLLR